MPCQWRPALVIAFVLPAITATPAAHAADATDPLVRATVRAHASELVACFGRANRRHPGLTGTVTVAAVVTDGVVGDLTISEDTVDSARLNRCALRHIRRWRFEGWSGDWTWPFAFQVR